jgi:preprotein translocase subunit YajC
MIESIFAQDAAASGNPITSFLPLVAIFVIFYFLMIRPQKKQLDEEKKMLDALGKGQEIYTKSGILGTVTGMTEKVITLEIADSIKIKVLRSQIGGLASKIFEVKKDAKK